MEPTTFRANLIFEMPKVTCDYCGEEFPTMDSIVWQDSFNVYKCCSAECLLKCLDDIGEQISLLEYIEGKVD